MAVYACSDLHGNYEIYQNMNKFLKPKDEVYFLGDAADRGLEGWKLIKAIYNNPQWIYFKGNHEDMLVKAMREYHKYFNDGGIVGRDQRLLYANGGAKTLDDWIMEGAKSEWINLLNQLPIMGVYKNNQGTEILMSHAGYTPCFGNAPTEQDLLWDREHFYDWDWEDPNRLVLHGHTPIPYLAEDLRVKETIPLKYSNGCKIDIDCATFMTGESVLLDLDTFDSYIFDIYGLKKTS